jgi:hippurate hydrolase
MQSSHEAIMQGYGVDMQKYLKIRQDFH